MMSVCKPAPMTTERRSFKMSVGSRPVTANRFAGQEEPCLDDLLADPITRRLMASDGVPMDHLLNVIATARSRLV